MLIAFIFILLLFSSIFYFLSFLFFSLFFFNMSFFASRGFYDEVSDIPHRLLPYSCDYFLCVMKKQDVFDYFLDERFQTRFNLISLKRAFYKICIDFDDDHYCFAFTHGMRRSSIFRITSWNFYFIYHLFCFPFLPNTPISPSTNVFHVLMSEVLDTISLISTSGLLFETTFLQPGIINSGFITCDVPASSSDHMVYYKHFSLIKLSSLVPLFFPIFIYCYCIEEYWILLFYFFFLILLFVYNCYSVFSLPWSFEEVDFVNFGAYRYILATVYCFIPVLFYFHLPLHLFRLHERQFSAGSVLQQFANSFVLGCVPYSTLEYIFMSSNYDVAHLASIIVV